MPSRVSVERDLICGRGFDDTKTFLPSRRSLVHEPRFLRAGDKRLLRHARGRTCLGGAPL